MITSIITISYWNMCSISCERYRNNHPNCDLTNNESGYCYPFIFLFDSVLCPYRHEYIKHNNTIDKSRSFDNRTVNLINNMTR